MVGIYKITNIITGKVYVGQSVHIESRVKEHKNPSNWIRESGKVLYRAFLKYGIENFTFEVVEECEAEKLSEREIYWISFFNSFADGYNMTSGGESNYGDSSPLHKLTEADVIEIRKRYANKERRKEVYLDYKDRIGEHGFGKIWKGETWKNTMMEVYTPENKEFQRRNSAMKGTSNGRSLLTEEDVVSIRTRRKNGEKMKDVFSDYENVLTYGSFKNVWYYVNWKHIIV